ncbi:hypothetical protein QRD40_05260 [Comamonas sp. Y6]|uniref:HNH endonuclease n=1 Tax=Comamonas resistens TaxID=3046670 RepID=A0ABY8SS46_9BURK|nr:hypothetical protein [Comamonas resistens]MDL5035755.1 hypothetical protein [Comamonas resistens]WHS65169.1 hypothetical protein QMY55_22230 [Comamonas resistens]
MDITHPQQAITLTLPDGSQRHLNHLVTVAKVGSSNRGHGKSLEKRLMPDSSELRSRGLKVTVPHLQILAIFQKADNEKNT